MRLIVGRVDARRAVPWPPLVAAALIGALAGPAQLVVHTCVPGTSSLGWLGLRLALLRSSVDCPNGSLALGGSVAQSALVVISIAIPTLLAHLLALAGGVSLSAVLARAASAARRVLGAALWVLPAAPRARCTPAALVAHRDLAVARAWELTGRHGNRGPPALSAA